MQTVQLRRYEMLDGVMDDFIAWFETLAPARRQYGFEILFAFADRETNQFVWAVGYDGADFDAAVATYNDSPERAAVFAGQPSRVKEMHLALVDVVVAPSQV